MLLSIDNFPLALFVTPALRGSHFAIPIAQNEVLINALLIMNQMVTKAYTAFCSSAGSLDSGGSWIIIFSRCPF